MKTAANPSYARDYDRLVVGAGGAGMAAALFAVRGAMMVDRTDITHLLG